MSQLIDNIIVVINSRGDSGYVGGTLIAVGFIPLGLFTSDTLSAIYFLLLIPPAAYHCYLWSRKTVYPVVKSWFN